MCGELDIDRFLKCVYGAIEQTMQAQPWQKAFDENGFGAAHDKLSKAIRSHLELAGEVARPCGPPNCRRHPPLLSTGGCGACVSLLAHGDAEARSPCCFFFQC